MLQAIHTDDAPSAIGAYSQAIKVGNQVYTAGQIGMDPKTSELIADDLEQQLVQAFANLKAVLQAAGGELSAVVKITVYLTDFADFAVLNEVMESVFTSPYPARTTLQVTALPKGAKVEVEAIAVLA